MYQDSVEAFAVLKAKKNVDLFRKYGVLNKAEVDSRTHVAVEKYVKQLGIEAERRDLIARTQILPAVLQQPQLQAARRGSRRAGANPRRRRSRSSWAW